MGAFLGLPDNVIYTAASDASSASLSQLYGEIESQALEKLGTWCDLDELWEVMGQS